MITIADITQEHAKKWNALATHPLQSYEWGEFREKTGITVIRKGIFDDGTLLDGFQLTIHKIPHTPWAIGYLPKGHMPSKEIITELKKIGKEHNCIFIQLEPNITTSKEHIKELEQLGLVPSAHPLFTQYTFQLDLTPSEEDLLKSFHPKTRYNIKVAQKHNVHITKEDSLDAFASYWALTQETTKRQGFHAHTKQYHELMWETLQKPTTQGLQAHLFLATYTPPQENKALVLAAWILFTFHNSLYYPYGASSNLYRNVMASNLMMWEAIRFGKEKHLTNFDMWGSLGENPDPKDPWFGFHRLKMGYNPTLVKFVGSFDLVLHPMVYTGFKLADKLRWLLLR